MRRSSWKRRVVSAIVPVVLMVGGTTQVRADVFDLFSLAAPYAVFGLGSNLTLGDKTFSILGNTAQIYGDVAIGADTNIATGLAGYGDFQKGFIDGSLYVDANVVGSAGYAAWSLDKNFGVTGTIDGNLSPCTNIAGCGGSGFSGTGQTDLMPAVQDAVAASTYWATQSGTNIASISLNSGTQTLTAGVYYTTNFSMNKSLLTISGSATDVFVLNISGGFDFQKSFIQLTGGITWDNVLFNVTGTGGTASISGDNSLFAGTLLAVNRSIDIQGIGSAGGSVQGVNCGADNICGTDDDNAGLLGRVIGALSTTSTELQLHVYSGAEINAPYTPPPPPPPPTTVPEPATMILLGTGLLGIAGSVRRRRRKQEETV